VHFLISFRFSSSVLIQHVSAENRWSTGSPGGKTGAPGDGVCTDCHTGTVQSGIGMNSLIISDQNGPVTSYTPGMDYEVTISMNTSNAKNGFEIVALNSSNEQAGNTYIMDGATTQSIDIGNRTHITHQFDGNSLNSWIFGWTAPLTNEGMITFYLATNLTNGNMGGDGDVIYTSQHNIGSTASIQEASEQFGLEAIYNKIYSSIQINLKTKEFGEVAVNLVDLNGKSVLFERLGKVKSGDHSWKLKLEEHFPKGLYVLHVNVNNDFTTRKVYVY
jgi:hypothetical protein